MRPLYLRHCLRLGLGFSLALALTACETNVKTAVMKDPDIVFQAITDHPQEFLDVVNRAVQAAQDAKHKNVKPALDEKRRLSGSPSGKIVMVEYADFQCPACGMAYEGLKKFKEVHKDDIQFYYKNMPLDFHKMAMPSGQYYEAVFRQGADKAQKFYDIVFSHQRELNEDFLRKSVTTAGADIKKVDADIKSGAVKPTIEADMAEFSKLGFTGTPTFVINGVALEGAQSYEGLEHALVLAEKR